MSHHKIKTIPVIRASVQVHTEDLLCVNSVKSCLCCWESVLACRHLSAHLSAGMGGGEGPRGEHTPPAHVRLFQNRGQHLVIFYESCTHARVSLLTSTLILGLFLVFFSSADTEDQSRATLFFIPALSLKLCVVTAGYFYAPAQGQCLGLFWSKSTSRNKSRTTVSWNVRMVSLKVVIF